MTSSKAEAIGPDLRRLFEGGSVAALTEAQLLDRVARRDVAAEAAFEAILTRHGPAVLACYRRVLGDPSAAEDAFHATFLVMIRQAGTIRVGESLRPWLMHVSPDGRLVTPDNFVSSTVSGKGQPGTDLAIRIYELASGKEAAALKGCTDQVSALAFCPDGRTLAAAGGNFWHARDRTVRLWDIASGRGLRRFDNHPVGATAIAYLPGGRSLVTIGMDGVALVWDVSDLVDRRPHERPDLNPVS
jgi:Sigma-70 region 2/WD domain, G-beta repeat